MRFSVSQPDIAAAWRGTEEEIARAMTRGMEDVGRDLIEDLRGDVVRAGLGRRLANSWRGRTYPRGQTSLEPSAYVWSKAPKIVDAYQRGALIRSRGGRFLAIPTDDTPRKRQGNALTPAEVEARFGRKLVFVEPGARGFWTPTRTKPGVAYLVLKHMAIRRSSGRYRNASAREMDKYRRGEKALNHVVMFILVPQVRVRKRLTDLDALARDAAARIPAAVARHWS